MARTPKFSRVRHGIEKGLDKLRKWYMATDQTDIYFICLGASPLFAGLGILVLSATDEFFVALEPSIKLEYTKQKWDKDCYDKGVAAFENVVRHSCISHLRLISLLFLLV
jgi:hypothetical protein